MATANISIDPASWVPFILRWTFAGVWLTLGWALAAKFVLPLVPGL